MYEKEAADEEAKDEREMVTVSECEGEKKDQWWTMTQDGFVVGRGNNSCLAIMSQKDPRVRLHSCLAGSQQVRWCDRIIHLGQDSVKFISAIAVLHVI